MSQQLETIEIDSHTMYQLQEIAKVRQWPIGKALILAVGRTHNQEVKASRTCQVEGCSDTAKRIFTNDGYLDDSDGEKIDGLILKYDLCGKHADQLKHAGCWDSQLEDI